MQVVITTGGTGGHVFPAVALAESLQAQGTDVSIISDARGLALVPPTIPTHVINAASPQKPGIVEKIKAVMRLMNGLWQTLLLLRQTRPKIIISFGSYASVPVVVAASILRIPFILHEQNAVLGLAHRVASFCANKVALSFAITQRIPGYAFKKTIVTGNPVREQIMALAKTPYMPPHDNQPIALLITSGSLGARIFSEVIPAAMAQLPEGLRQRLHITQQCRADDLAMAQAVYDKASIQAELAPFFTDIGARIAAAQLVICRAGASTVAEILTLGRPAIYVPLPSAADNHQTANAVQVEQSDTGWHLPQNEFTPSNLASMLQTLLQQPKQLVHAHDAAKQWQAHQGTEKLLSLVNSFI